MSDGLMIWADGGEPGIADIPTGKLAMYNNGGSFYAKNKAGTVIMLSSGGDMTKAVYDAANIAEQLTGLTATQTLTNKTLTSPVVNSPTGIDADDIDDSSTTNKFTTAADITKLLGIEALAEVNNISDVNATDLTDGGDSTLHFHSSDRARANHTGTQLASTISDFDTEVSNNTSVSANTAKVTNANHTGDATGSTALTLATVNSNVGSFTNADITVNAKGLVTAAANGSSAGGAWGAISGVLTDQTDLETALDGKQPIDQALTDISGLTLSQGDIFYVNGSGNIVNLGAGVLGQFLKTLGTGNDPLWANPAGNIACCQFGAKSDGTGSFLIANGKSTDGDDSTKPKTRQPIAMDGTLIRLAYKTKDGNATTQMKIHVNGVVEQTVVLSSMNANDGGVETISVSVTAGDYVEIEYDASQKPGECTMYFIQELS